MSTLARQHGSTSSAPSSRFYTRAIHAFEDAVDDINWIRMALKTCAFTYIAFIAWITWQVLPLPGHWDHGRQPDKIPATFQDLPNYFGTFHGFTECAISALRLYPSPATDERGNYATNTFCSNRKTLLRAMSNGGRIGFDSPYVSKDCHYRWYTSTEVCMILDRFDGLVFAGDASLQSIYNGFNIIMRQDLAHGALKTWSMTAKDKAECRCSDQFQNPACSKYFVKASEEVSTNVERSNKRSGTDYVCQRTPHVFLEIDASKLKQATVGKFTKMVPMAARSNYKPIPVIHSLSPATGSYRDVRASLLEFAKLADLSGRKTPMLWVGPTAAGHIEIRGRKTNQEIWDFDTAIAKTAADNEIEVLKMWNMTVQATSWDGMRFGEEVALVQAMMVINWLSRLESS